MSRSSTTTRGFTIVELLIVIVVIGILAAITIVAYNGVQNKASEAAIQSDLRQLVSKFEAFKVASNNETYPQSTEDLESLNFKATKQSYMIYPTIGLNLGYCKDSASKRYVVVARAKSGKTYVATDGSVQATTSTDVTNCAGITGVSRLVSGYWNDSNQTTPWRDWAGR